MSDYRVRHISPRLVLEPLLGVAFVAVWTAVLNPPQTMIVFVSVVAIASSALRARANATRLRVDSRGIALGTEPHQPSVCVPWASVREVVVVPEIDADPRVGVRLQPGAPLPAGIRGIVHDPADPDRLQPSLVRTVPGLDRQALEAAVMAHDVRLVSGTES